METVLTPAFLSPHAHTARDLLVSNTPEHLASLLINHVKMKGCLEAEDECRKHWCKRRLLKNEQMVAGALGT